VFSIARYPEREPEKFAPDPTHREDRDLLSGDLDELGLDELGLDELGLG
jgi:hypothetical protein